ncbi:MAG: DNA-binding response regulator, partial [Terracidiphilus sp.]
MTMEGMVQSEKAEKDSGVIDARTQAARTQILVIEDDPHMQKVLQRIFREQGYAVTECGDGQTGLDAF